MLILNKFIFIVIFNSSIIIYFANLTFARKFHYARRLKTGTDSTIVYTSETLIGQRITECIDSCKAKKLCSFVNYDLRARLCHLVALQAEGAFQTDDFLEVKPGFYFGDKREWNMEEHTECDGCSEYGVCREGDESQHPVCLNSGCRPPEQKNNAVILGNMFSVSNKIEYECKEKYETNIDSLTSVCLENGNWSSVEFECSPEFYRFNDHFYKLIREEMNWDLAYEKCSSISGYLVDIKSVEEQNFITETITVVDKFKCYWTGGRRSLFYDFIRLDGTIVDLESSNWHPSQPNNVRNSQNCIELLKEFGYKWNDYDCSRHAT